MKILLLVVLFAALAACKGEKREYTLVYDIYWSANNVERKVVKSGTDIAHFCNEYGNYRVATYDGDRWYEVYNAPVRVVSYTYKVVEDKK